MLKSYYPHIHIFGTIYDNFFEWKNTSILLVRFVRLKYAIVRYNHCANIALFLFLFLDHLIIIHINLIERKEIEMEMVDIWMNEVLKWYPKEYRRASGNMGGWYKKNVWHKMVLERSG